MEKPECDPLGEVMVLLVKVLAIWRRAARLLIRTGASGIAGDMLNSAVVKCLTVVMD